MTMKRELKFRAWHPLNKEMVYEKKGQNFGYGDYTRSNILKDFEDDNIMQFTELRDKNGKEIYEGDIISSKVEDGTTVTHKIIFATAAFYAKPIYYIIHRAPESWPTCEVIGNIYENPELLIEPVK